MTIRDLVHRYFAYWHQADIEGLMSMYDPAMQYHDMPSGDVIGYPDLKQHVLNTFAFEAHSTFELKDSVFLDNNSAFIYWTQNFESSESGKLVTVNGVELIVFRDGLIVSIHEFYDYLGPGLESQEPAVKDEPSGQMLKLGLTEDQIERMSQEILSYFDASRPYLDPELSLAMVSEPLGYTRNQVSYVINHALGLTFYDLLNSRRVDHVIEQMNSSDPSVSILEMSINAGFNSMSGFYNAFKKQTGTTPVKYRKSKLA